MPRLGPERGSGHVVRLAKTLWGPAANLHGRVLPNMLSLVWGCHVCSVCQIGLRGHGFVSVWWVRCGFNRPQVGMCVS